LASQYFRYFSADCFLMSKIIVLIVVVPFDRFFAGGDKNVDKKQFLHNL
jgi:hypothetical protein